MVRRASLFLLQTPNGRLHPFRSILQHPGCGPSLHRPPIRIAVIPLPRVPAQHLHCLATRHYQGTEERRVRKVACPLTDMPECLQVKFSNKCQETHRRRTDIKGTWLRLLPVFKVSHAGLKHCLKPVSLWEVTFSIAFSGLLSNYITAQFRV